MLNPIEAARQSAWSEGYAAPSYLTADEAVAWFVAGVQERQTREAAKRTPWLPGLPNVMQLAPSHPEHFINQGEE